MNPVSQGGPNVSWLDEELRKEKAIVTELCELVDKQQVALVDQTQRIMALEGQLAKLQAQLLRIPEVEESLQHTRDQVVLMLSASQEEQQKRETEFLRNRRAEREQDVRAMQEIKVELQRFGSFEQAMAVRQAEEQRLNEAVLRMQQELEVIGSRLSQHEELSRQLQDTIGRNQVEIKQGEENRKEIQKNQQEHSARLLAAEDSVSKHEQQIAELREMRRAITEQQEELLENQRLAERTRAQAMAERGRRLEGYAHQLDVWADQLRHFSDQHERNRRVLRETQGLAQEISQQQDQLRQLQRVAEEQLRREFREWHRENDRRWAQEVERNERTTEAQAERDDKQEQRLSGIEHGQEDLAAMLESLSDRLKAIRTESLVNAEQTRQAQRSAWRNMAKILDDALAELGDSSIEREE